MTRPLSRRQALGLAGGVLGVAGAGAIGAARLAGLDQPAAATGPTGEPAPGTSVPFRGVHQAGVVEPVRAHTALVGVDLAGSVTDASALRGLLDRWTVAAERLVAGEQVGERSPSSRLPPVDTGEADDRPLSRLTITLAVGTPLFDGARAAALGVRPRPAGLVEPPPLAGDELDPRWGPTDLVVLVAGDDDVVVRHAVRNLVRVGEGGAVLRWSQHGTGPSPLTAVPGTSSVPSVNRNLFGFKEGTANPPPGSPELDTAVWVAPADDPTWMAGGTYVLARRHRLDLAAWDELNLLDRERVVGRHRRSGAPLGERDEHAPLDLEAEGPDGLPVIDPRSHVAVAHRASAGRPFLRRACNVTEGVPQAGGPEAGGQLLLAYARHLGTQVVPVLGALAAGDLLATYVRTTASVAAAVLPGVVDGQTWGDHLLTG